MKVDVETIAAERVIGSEAVLARAVKVSARIMEYDRAAPRGVRRQAIVISHEELPPTVFSHASAMLNEFVSAQIFPIR